MPPDVSPSTPPGVTSDAALPDQLPDASRNASAPDTASSGTAHAEVVLRSSPGREGAPGAGSGGTPGSGFGLGGMFSRPMVILVGAAALVVALAGVSVAADIIAPVLLALFLVITVYPLELRLVERGLPRWLGAIAVLAVVYLILIGLAAGVTLSVAQLTALLPNYESEFQALGDSLAAALASLGIDQGQVQDFIDNDLPGLVLGFVDSLLSVLTGALSGLSIVLVAMFFMAFDAASTARRLRTVSAHHPHLMTALSSFAAGTRRYLGITTVFGFIVAVVDVIVLVTLGVPLPLVWGLLAFVTNYVPNIGLVIGMIPPALLALLEGGPGLMLVVIIAYSVINVVLQSFVQPKVVGDEVGLSATLTFLSLVLWAWLLGGLGALLAVPLTLLVKALLVDADPGMRWLAPLFGRQGPPPRRLRIPWRSRLPPESS